MNNTSVLDVEHLNWEMTMPWPDVRGRSLSTVNGLHVDFIEPGVSARITYESADGSASFDVVQTAVTPLVARGHVMPGEEEQAAWSLSPGGSEQFMHCVGKLSVGAQTFDVDCHPARDRSWNQIRVETRAAVTSPPVSWTPMYFGPDLALSQISYEPLDADPPWKGTIGVAEDRPSHHFAWMLIDGDLRAVSSVRRVVLDRHPTLHAAVHQLVEVKDAAGVSYTFEGRALAMAAVPCWPNAALVDSIFEWRDGDGRVAHDSCQEIWFADYQRLMSHL
jgi:hypothetical protein